MPSLAIFDKTRWAAVEDKRNYRKDIAAGIEFNDRLFQSWEKSKERWSPRRVYLIGNHENRISRCIDADRQLITLLSLNDLQLERHYDHVQHDEGSSPGIYEMDGIACAHFFSNVMGRNLGGSLHGAHALCSKLHQSTISGHSHMLDYKVATTASGREDHRAGGGRLHGTVHAYSGVNQSELVARLTSSAGTWRTEVRAGVRVPRSAGAPVRFAQKPLYEKG